ncbi:hypothetical protein G6F35_018571 [Rhizopus arrhizus]|nr:hypothetical protein G6F35_018571 [Rhizopus arrhizus]
MPVPAADGTDDPAAAVRPTGEVAARPALACLRAAGTVAGTGHRARRTGLVAGAAEWLEGRPRRGRGGLGRVRYRAFQLGRAPV